MDGFLQNMVPKSQSKGLHKTPAQSTHDHGTTGAASSLSTRDNSPNRKTEDELGSDLAHDDIHIDYKRLAIEVAKRISPDIQETLADTVTNMFSKIQIGSRQHSQRLNALESRFQSWETATDKMQVHICSLLQENKRLGEKVDDLENRSRRNNLRIIGLAKTILQNDLVALCEK